MKTEQAKIEFAPDGQHFHAIKTAAGIEKLWDYFLKNVDIRQQIYLNPYAVFRLISENGNLIGCLPNKI